MDVEDQRLGVGKNKLSEEEMELRRGPWTVEEDITLTNYISKHGEGRWNSLARCAGLKRTGKSCRLRWLNYLHPDVRRGNITLEEQLLILELHSRWGNRWSKIAEHLPGRTDNEIKNYWRTRVQKHAKQLRCDVNSKQFKDTVRYLWMPRLVERIQAEAARAASPSAAAHHLIINNNVNMSSGQMGMIIPPPADFGGAQVNNRYTPEHSSTGASSDSFGTTSQVSDLTDYYCNYPFKDHQDQDYYPVNYPVTYPDSLISPSGYFNHGLDFQTMEQNINNQWLDQGDTSDNFWNVEDIWVLQEQQLNNNNISSM